MHSIQIPQSQFIVFNKQISLLSISCVPQKEQPRATLSRPIRIMNPRKRFRHHCFFYDGDTIV